MADESERRLARLFAAAYTGWGRGVVVTNDGSGGFSERPMTPLELEARYVGVEIGTNDSLALQRAFIPITVFQSIQRHIGPLVDAQQQQAEKWRAIAGELVQAMKANEVYLGNSRPLWDTALARYREAVAEEEGKSGA